MYFTNFCQAQYFDDSVWHYYYNPVSPAVSNDVAEAVDIDTIGRSYVCGEIYKETSQQDLKIIRYAPYNSDSIFVTYANNQYREYVKKVLCKNGYIYVICNAVKISTGIPCLMVVKYNSNLILSKVSIFSLNSFYGPVDAETDAGGNLLILCSERGTNSNNICIVKLSNALNLIDTESYSYQNLEDTYNETPKDMSINFTNNSLFICGGTSLGNTSAPILIKYDLSSLFLKWKKAPALIKGKSNIYNALAGDGTQVYATGSVNTSPLTNTGMLIANCLLSGKGFKTYTYNGPGGSYTQSEGIRFAYANSTIADIVGNSRDSLNNKYDIVIARYDPSQNTILYITNETLALGSSISDVETSRIGIYITGSRISGSKKYMFLYDYQTPLGTAYIKTYQQEIINKSAGGNDVCFRKINNTLTVTAIVGFQDQTKNLTQPNDYKMFTRILTQRIISLTGKNTVSYSLSKTNAPAGLLLQNMPNPFTNKTIINYTLPQKYTTAQLIITDKSGRQMQVINLKGNGSGKITVDASQLTTGSFQYTLYADGKMIESKQMMCTK